MGCCFALTLTSSYTTHEGHFVCQFRLDFHPKLFYVSYSTNLLPSLVFRICREFQPSLDQMGSRSRGTGSICGSLYVVPSPAIRGYRCGITGR